MLLERLRPGTRERPVAGAGKRRGPWIKAEPRGCARERDLAHFLVEIHSLSCDCSELEAAARRPFWRQPAGDLLYAFGPMISKST